MRPTQEGYPKGMEFGKRPKEVSKPKLEVTQGSSPEGTVYSNIAHNETNDSEPILKIVPKDFNQGESIGHLVTGGGEAQERIVSSEVADAISINDMETGGDRKGSSLLYDSRSHDDSINDLVTGGGESEEVDEKKIREQQEKARAERICDSLGIHEGEQITDQYGDSYMMEKMLGAGGFGAVFRVTNERNGMERAIKFMHSGIKNNPSIEKRFKREIATLAKMKDPFILKAIDVAHFDIDGEDVVGFVTEFVEGPDLTGELRSREKETDGEGLEIEKSAIYAAEIALALSSLEAAGIVHRDLKPDNIFLQQMHDGSKMVKVGDFGIVTFAQESGVKQAEGDSHEPITGEHPVDITLPGMFIGTVMYTSPEAAQAKNVDQRADLYSLGLIMYQMVSNKSPFDAETGQEYLMKHVMEDPVPFSEHGVDVPEWMEDIIIKLLQKNPDDRYQHGMDVFHAIKQGIAEHHPELLDEIPFMYGPPVDQAPSVTQNEAASTGVETSAQEADAKEWNRSKQNDTPTVNLRAV